MKTINCSDVYKMKGDNSIVALTEMLIEEFEDSENVRVESAKIRGVTWSDKEVAFTIADGINCRFSPKKAHVLDVSSTLSSDFHKVLEGRWYSEEGTVPYFSVSAVEYNRNRYV